MPGPLNQIQGGRWDEMLRRLFSMKQGAIAPVVGTEISPIIVIENDRPEHQILAGTVLCGGQLDRGGVAAEFAMGEVWNPAESGMLAVVTHCIVSLTGAQIVLGSLSNVELANGALTATRLDTRPINWLVGATFDPTIQIRHESAAGVVANVPISQARVAANIGTEIVRTPIILKPGTGFMIRGGAVNTAFIATFEWYERPVNPSEEFIR